MKLGRTVILLIWLAILMNACGGKIDENMSESVDYFEFTTQNNKQFGLDELKDEWWVAYFMYTNCTTVCPTTTPNMVDVQNELNDTNLYPQIVSFSIDPENDTPEVLKEYADEYGADLENWTFLTGDEFDEIQELSENSFKTVLEDGGPESHEYVHSTNFFLINPEGNIVKKYDGMSSNETDQLVNDLKKVL